MDTTKFCPYCKEEIKADAVKCRHCGSMLGDETVLTANDPTTAIKLALGPKYEILEEAGRGGMAIVYKAIQRNLERVVALKAVSSQLTNDTEFIERFHREARSTAKLSHPNIIIVHDEGVEGGVHYIAMEYLQGTDLNRLIRTHGHLSPEDTIEYIAPIASALEYAHAHGLVHRDVKSSNIFIAENRRPVLTDFGIAHAAAGTHLTMAGTILGTPDFMSPEQASGKPLDGRSDIYGLGVVLYHGLTGRLPFKSDSALTTIYRVVSEMPLPINQIASVPLWLETVVNRCLEKDPNKRIQSGGELAQALRARSSPIVVSSNETVFNLGVNSEQMRQAPSRERAGATVMARSTARSRTTTRTPPPPQKQRSYLPVVIAIATMVIAVVGWFMYQAGLFSPRMAIVPGVMGLPWQEAKSRLEKTELRAILAGGPSAGKTRVVGQNPMAGAKTKPGTAVSLFTEKVMVQVPNLTGMSPEQATEALKSAGLNLGSSIQRAGPPEEQGIVVHQIPEAGSSLEDGSAVTVIVGI